jgi:hypothetical protein
LTTLAAVASAEATIIPVTVTIRVIVLISHFSRMHRRGGAAATVPSPGPGLTGRKPVRDVITSSEARLWLQIRAAPIVRQSEISVASRCSGSRFQCARNARRDSSPASVLGSGGRSDVCPHSAAICADFERVGDHCDTARNRGRRRDTRHALS